jgi:hypothetical protein
LPLPPGAEPLPAVGVELPDVIVRPRWSRARLCDCLWTAAAWSAGRLGAI